jgi:hypothetical protein
LDVGDRAHQVTIVMVGSFPGVLKRNMEGGDQQFQRRRNESAFGRVNGMKLNVDEATRAVRVLRPIVADAPLI